MTRIVVLKTMNGGYEVRVCALQLRSCLLIVSAMTMLLASCNHTGPTAIRNGRLAYNEAILATDNQQMLLAVIKERYTERSELLMVSSITANIRMTASAGVELGFGDSSDVAGNLTPLSGRVIYEENPIISYSPVNGQLYTNKLLGRTSLENLALLSSSAQDPSSIFEILVSRVNSISNPNGREKTVDVRFEHFASRLSALVKSRQVYWARSPDREDQLLLVIARDSGNREAVQELMDLLELTIDPGRNGALIIPVDAGQSARAGDGISFVTRSIYDMVRTLAAAIEVPEIDMRNGVVENYPESVSKAERFHVRWSEKRPDHAIVDVPYRDGWFYIDERDQATKYYFRVLTVVWSAAIADSTLANPAPILTVPVGR